MENKIPQNIFSSEEINFFKSIYYNVLAMTPWCYDFMTDV